MVDQRYPDTPPRPLSPAELDTRDPAFRERCRAWADELKREIEATIAASKETIAASKDLLARCNRLLGR